MARILPAITALLLIACILLSVLLARNKNQAGQGDMLASIDEVVAGQIVPIKYIAYPATGYDGLLLQYAEEKTNANHYPLLVHGNYIVDLSYDVTSIRYPAGKPPTGYSGTDFRQINSYTLTIYTLHNTHTPFLVYDMLEINRQLREQYPNYMIGFYNQGATVIEYEGTRYLSFYAHSVNYLENGWVECFNDWPDVYFYLCIETGEIFSDIPESENLPPFYTENRAYLNDWKPRVAPASVTPEEEWGFAAYQLQAGWENHYWVNSVLGFNYETLDAAIFNVFPELRETLANSPHERVTFYLYNITQEEAIGLLRPVGDRQTE